MKTYPLAPSHKISQGLILLSFLITISCNEPHISKGKEVLSDQDLVTILSANKDFIGLIDALKKRNESTEIWLTKLAQKDKEALKLIFNKYKDSKEFEMYGSLSERLLFPNIQDNLQEYHTSLLKSLDTKYIYDRTILLSLIEEKVSMENKEKNSKSMMSCDDVWTTVYIQELNYYYYEGGFSIDDAHRSATKSANWAKIGCRMAEL